MTTDREVIDNGRAAQGVRTASTLLGPPADWVTVRQAAALVGVSREHVRWLAKRDELVGALFGGRWWVDPASAEALRVDRSRWMSVQEAAQLAGCATGTIWAAAHRGELVYRPRGRAYPSLERNSVAAWIRGRRADERAHAEAQDERRRAKERSQRRAATPDQVHDWLTAVQAADLLGITRVRVDQLARRDRLPFTTIGRRRWYRRDHLEQRLRVRAFNAQRN